MLSVFSVERNNSLFEIEVGNGGGIKITHVIYLKGKELQTSSWTVHKFPEDFVFAAETALKCPPSIFEDTAEEGLLKGTFWATEKREMIRVGLYRDNLNKPIEIVLRRSELAKIISIIRYYWNQR